MDKKNAIRRVKRPSKVLEDNYWDCSVCTYRNNAEAFKCLMCDVRKGTSTRKPRLNPALVAAQAVAPSTSTSSKRKGSGSKHKKRSDPPRLKNVDRSSAQTREVTVNSVTVVITEYKPLKGGSGATAATTTTNGSASSSEPESGEARA